MLGIIPIIYVINVWRKVRHEIVFSAFLGPLIAIEYLLAVFWFALTFPVWLIYQIGSLATTGTLLLEGIWVIHSIVYGVIIKSYFLVPAWIRRVLGAFTQTYGETVNRPEYGVNIDARRMIRNPTQQEDDTKSEEPST